MFAELIGASNQVESGVKNGSEEEEVDDSGGKDEDGDEERKDTKATQMGYTVTDRVCKLESGSSCAQARIRRRPQSERASEPRSGKLEVPHAVEGCLFCFR